MPSAFSHKLPVSEKELYEVRVHSERLYGSVMYQIKDLSPSAIITKAWKITKRRRGGRKERREKMLRGFRNW